jgi:hypothetical protein
MLLLDFCNIKEWTCETVLELYKDYLITHSEYGGPEGFELFCVPRHYGDGTCAFALVDDTGNLPHKWLGRPVFMPDDQGYSQLWGALKFSRETIYEPFLKKCARGEIDLRSVNDQFEDFQVRKLRMSLTHKQVSKKKESWILKPVFGNLPAFEDWVDWELLSMFFNQGAGILRKIHRCAWEPCSAYFLSARKDQKYCSDGCSSSMRSARWRATLGEAEARKYQRKKMREGRKEGKYQ